MSEESGVDRLRPHATRIAVYSPLFAVVLTLSYLALDQWLGRSTALASATDIVFIINAALAFAGSATGGFLRHAPLIERVTLAIGFGAVGLVAYLGFAGCLGGMSHRW